ncbi:hypothetical protein BVIET440_290028 [Burkholderia vietnamiensis]
MHCRRARRKPGARSCSERSVIIGAGRRDIRCSVVLITKAENLSSKKSFLSPVAIHRLISRNQPGSGALASGTIRPASHPDLNAHHACAA